MGKPFKSELLHIKDIIEWANIQDVTNLKFFFDIENNLPLICIGSGGSFSACYYSSLLYESKYQIAKAQTPFDFFSSKNVSNKSKVLFISASGKNNDIQFALDKAIESGAVFLSNLSMKETNPLSVKLNNLSNSYSSNYNIPTGKDGFLATNSLIAFFSLLYLSYNEKKIEINSLLSLSDQKFHQEIRSFTNEIADRNNITLLYGGWGLPVAYDIESKCTEAALSAVLLTDYRNFGHGRHHWFDKHKKTSAIVALVTPNERLIAEKTLSLIPSDIPRLIISTEIVDSLGSLDLLIKSFFFISNLGDIRNIDPGKPGVPDFGRKLYHLRYSSIYKVKMESVANSAICKKAGVVDVSEISDGEKQLWLNAYKKFTTNLKNNSFSDIVFDYDGTICSTKNRFETHLESITKNYLLVLLKNDIKIGIVTGRGKSIKELLRNTFDKTYWDKIIVGYYNGANVGYLSDDSLPIIDSNLNDSLIKISEAIKKNGYFKINNALDITIRPQQLTIKASDIRTYKFIKSFCNQYIERNNIDNICILESSHSLDIIVRPTVSKLNIFKDFLKEENTLCIGDKGLFPGNDYELLSTQYSLSVSEVSIDLDSCWNLAPENNSNINNLHFYLSKIELLNNKRFKINI